MALVAATKVACDVVLVVYLSVVAPVVMIGASRGLGMLPSIFSPRESGAKTAAPQVRVACTTEVLAAKSVFEKYRGRLYRYVE